MKYHIEYRTPVGWEAHPRFLSHSTLLEAVTDLCEFLRNAGDNQDDYLPAAHNISNYRITCCGDVVAHFLD